MPISLQPDKKVPEANSIEKVIPWRVLILMRTNIQPTSSITRDVLLKISHHRAPTEVEAEAEYARSHGLGMVDAMRTNDGDAFTFGAEVSIKEHREDRDNTVQKSDNLVRIYLADNIKQKHRLN
jgi:hypothetical protein